MSNYGGGEIVSLNGFTPETPIRIAGPDGGVSISVRDAMRWMIPPDVPEPEALRFLMVCRSEGLNPYLREIEIIQTSARWEIIITRAGYLKKANNHPAYAGLESGLIVRPWDTKTRTFTGPPVEIEGTFMPPDHLLVGGWARVYRRDRDRQSYARVSMTEYAKEGGAWKQIPCTMINKVAIVHAFRESGLITTGWYDPAELGTSSTRPPVVEAVPAAIEAEYVHAAHGCCPPDLLHKITAILEYLGVDRTTDPSWRAALAERGVATEADLLESDAVYLLGKLSAFEPHAELEPEAAQRWAAIVDQITTVDITVESEAVSPAS